MSITNNLDLTLKKNEKSWIIVMLTIVIDVNHEQSASGKISDKKVNEGDECRYRKVEYQILLAALLSINFFRKTAKENSAKTNNLINIDII